nr:zinc finger, CCHC-type [Tanacetum cinerariifolium]
MAAAMKHMASKFSKLEKFEGVDFRRLKKKMHFLLFSKSVVYVLTTLIPEDGGDNLTVEQVRRRAKWDNDDYVYRGLILNELGSHLRIKESLRVHDSDKPKGNNVVGPLVVNMVEHNNSSRYNDNKGKWKHHDTKVDPNKKLKVTCWKCGKPGHLKRDCKGGNVGNKGNRSGTKGSGDGSSNPMKAFMSTFKWNDSILWHARLGHVYYKGMQDMCEDGLILAFNMDTEKCKTCIPTKITKKSFQNVKRGTKVLELIHSDLCDLHVAPPLGNKKYFVTFIGDASRVWGYREVVKLPDSKLKTLDERGIECVFVGYAEHSKALRFYVIKPNDSVAINSIIKSRDAIFDEHRFLSVPRPSQRSLEDRTGNSSGSVVSERVTEEDDPKTFDKAMKSQDVAFWKEAINDEMDFIMSNNTWVLPDLSPGKDGHQGFKQKLRIYYFDTYTPMARISTIRLMIAMASIHNLIIHQMDVKTAFLNGELEEEVYMNQHLGFIMPGNENKVDLTKEFVSSRFSMKDMGEPDVILGIKIKHKSNGIVISQSYYIEKVLKKFNYSDCTLVSTPLDICEKLMPNKGLTVSQLEYSRVIGCLMPDIAFDVGKISRYTSNPVLESYTDASWISNSEDNSSTRGWVFLLGGGAISWASKKETCITGSIIEYEFMALAAAGKEAEWLKYLLFEIPLWYKPMEPISIHCDSVATLAKAYSQMYNGKFRHLGIRHSMIRELIMNGVISIEFRAKAYVLQIILRMCLELADKEDEVVNFSMVKFFENVLTGRVNKKEPPM